MQGEFVLKRVVPICILVLIILRALTVQAFTVADSDLDGMPDSWELQYGLDPNDGGDATSDLDNDGLSNIREFHNSTVPTNPLSGGRAQVAYTYNHEMTQEKLDPLLAAGMNTVVVKAGLENNVDYTSLPDDLPQDIHDYASLAYVNHFMYFQGLYFVFRNFNPNASHVPGAFPVVYSDGVTGKHVSPFCAAYWHHLTNLTVALANLSLNHPTEYRCDGVWLDFELYHQEDDGRPRYFDGTWGYEDPTFKDYVTDRGLEGLNPPLGSDQRDERYPWLVSNGLLNDYYQYLGLLLEDFAEEMRLAVHAVNPAFMIGACPSPVSGYWYLTEVDTGLSTLDEPLVLWGTETYNGRGSETLPDGLIDLLLPDGTFNLSSLYPSAHSDHVRIYGYYLAGLRLAVYYTGSLAYQLYMLLRNTSGYWVFSTQSLTQPYQNLTSDYHILYHNTTSNIVSEAADAVDHAKSALQYLDNFTRAASENRNFFNTTSYQTTLGYWLPAPVQYEDPDVLACPQPDLVPISNQTGQDFSFASNQLRFRGQHAFLLYATQGVNATIGVHHYPVGSPEIIDGLSYTVTDESDSLVASGRFASNQTSDIEFMPSSTGFYLLHINPVSNAFEIISTNVPIAVYQIDPLHLMSLPGSLYLWIPTNDTQFSVDLTGFGTSEGAKISVQHPNASGYEVIVSGATSILNNSIHLDVTVPVNTSDSLWKITVSAPDAPQHLEDLFLELSSNHTVLSLTNESRLAFRSPLPSDEEEIPPPVEPPSEPPAGDPSGPDNETNQTDDPVPPSDDNATDNETSPGGDVIPPMPPADNETEQNSSAIITNGGGFAEGLSMLVGIVSQPVSLVGIAGIGLVGVIVVFWRRRTPRLEALEEEQTFLDLITKASAEIGTPAALVYYEQARSLLLNSESTFSHWQYHSLEKELLKTYDEITKAPNKE